MEDVPNCALTFCQGLEALPCCRVPDAAVECALTARLQGKGISAAYISPSQAHETIRLASRLKCTAVT